LTQVVAPAVHRRVGVALSAAWRSRRFIIDIEYTFVEYGGAGATKALVIDAQ
jgi:hypothetical protein